MYNCVGSTNAFEANGSVKMTPFEEQEHTQAAKHECANTALSTRISHSQAYFDLTYCTGTFPACRSREVVRRELLENLTDSSPVKMCSTLRLAVLVAIVGEFVSFCLVLCTSVAVLVLKSDSDRNARHWVCTV